MRVTRRLRGKLHTTLEKIEHGHHVFRAYWKNAFVKQYEKFSTFLRGEVCSNNLRDFGLKKGLDHLAEVRRTFLGVLDRFATLQASALNVHVDFPFFQRLAQPVQLGATRIPGLKIHDPRVARLLEVLLHGSTTVGGRTSAQLHEAVLTTYPLSSDRYRLAQLRYDLRKLRAHGLLQRHDRRYAYRLTPRASRSPCSSLSFTSVSAAPWPTASFTTGLTRPSSPIANSRLLTTKPTPPFNRSSSWCKLHEIC
jgi:hypothetical protein